MNALIEKLKKARRVAVFAGAGVSTLCGIPDFRGPQGLYKQPDITFFGEMLPERALNLSVALAREADLMLVLGSSLTVHPAASIPPMTVRCGGELVIVNAQPTPLDRLATARYPDLAVFAAAILDAYE